MFVGVVLISAGSEETIAVASKFAGISKIKEKVSGRDE